MKQQSNIREAIDNLGAGISCKIIVDGRPAFFGMRLPANAWRTLFSAIDEEYEKTQNKRAGALSANEAVPPAGKERKQ